MSCSHRFHTSSRQRHSPETSPVISSSLPIWYWNITTELLQTCLRDAFPCVGLGPSIHQAFLPSTLCFSLPTSFTGHPLPFSGNNQYWLHAQPDSLLAWGARRKYQFLPLRNLGFTAWQKRKWPAAPPSSRRPHRKYMHRHGVMHAPTLSKEAQPFSAFRSNGTHLPTGTLVAV